MWTKLFKRASSRKFNLSSESFYFPFSSSSSSNSLKFYRQPNFPEKTRPTRTQTLPRYPFLGFNQVGVFASKNELGRSKFSFSEDPFGFSSSLKLARGYGSVAEVIESTDTEDDYPGSDEVQKLLEEMLKEEEKRKSKPQLEEQKKDVGVEGMVSYKYKLLRRRQIKMETEAWEEAAREYQVLKTEK